jgi:hypothetical protein
MGLTGLTSLSVLMAEFEYKPDSDMYVFDARPLAACPRLHRLLLELHGVKGSLNDVQGLAGLQHLSELVVLLKCPDVHEARPEAALQPASVAGSHTSSGSGAGGALLPGGGSAPCDHAGGSGGAGGGRLMQRVRGLLDGSSRAPGSAAGAGHQHEAALLPPDAGAAAARAGGGAHSHGGGSGAAAGAAPEVPLLSEEWVLALVDHALDQLRPEFALALPLVTGRLLVATTNRLCLRQPEHFLRARQPMLLAAALQLDLASCCDSWSGESFFNRMGLSTLRSWVARSWAPAGVHLIAPARYPVLGTYPGCRQRIDDKLLAAARRGVPGAAVVAAVMAVAEERCMSYFC